MNPITEGIAFARITEINDIATIWFEAMPKVVKIPTKVASRTPNPDGEIGNIPNKVEIGYKVMK
jgi:hypothetical protein